MADIRTTPVRDTFSRADEIPLSGGGTWDFVDTFHWPLELDLINQAAVHPLQFATEVRASRYIPLSFSNDAQIWAGSTGKPFAQESQSLRFFTNTGGTAQNIDGYAAHWFSGSPSEARLYRFDDSVQTLLATSAGFVAWPVDMLMLMQTVGTHVELYHSIDGGANWIQDVDHVDNTYRSDFKCVLEAIGGFDGPNGFTEFGGGPSGTLETTVQLPYLGVGP